jgi:hypothetical protein
MDKISIARFAARPGRHRRWPGAGRRAHIDPLVQPTAFLIVVGGTLGAVMLQSPLQVFS